MKTYFKLYEEFTRTTGVPFIEKLRMYAEASDVPTDISKIEQNGVDASFWIDTKIPGDWNGGTKKFHVVIPLNTDIPYIETYENGKMAHKDTIEAQLPPKSTTVIDIFFNYVEIAQLFNDPATQMLADNFDKFKSPDEIRKSIEKYG